MARGLAARCWQLHAAAGRGDGRAAQRLDRLTAAGARAAQAAIDLEMGWHRHAGHLDPCDDPWCAEVSDGTVWAASWELYWPPGKPPSLSMSDGSYG